MDQFTAESYPVNLVLERPGVTLIQFPLPTYLTSTCVGSLGQQSPEHLIFVVGWKRFEIMDELVPYYSVALAR